MVNLKFFPSPKCLGQKRLVFLLLLLFSCLGGEGAERSAQKKPDVRKQLKEVIDVFRGGSLQVVGSAVTTVFEYDLSTLVK